MTIPEVFQLTTEEHARLEASPFRDTPPEVCRVYASAVHELMVDAYREGDITLQRALDIVWNCSLGCARGDAIVLQALTARRAHLQPPPPGTKVDSRRKSTAIQRSAVHLLKMLCDARPDEPFVPNQGNNNTTRILEDAIVWLTTLRLIVEPITPWTLYNDWYLPTKRQMDADR